MSRESTAPPLEGIRVLDLTRVFSGPICGRMLADLGADVIKVEAPSGDIVRTTPPRVGGHAAMYAHMNAGKRNLCLDLKASGAVQLLERLISRCDILLENFRPDVLASIGLDPAALSERFPRLVYCSITGWGSDGPRSDRPAYAPLVHAEAGSIELASRLRGTPPSQELHQHGDLYAGVVGFGAILAALYQRERTGLGQHVDVSMAETLLYVNEHVSVDLAGYTGARGFDTWTFATCRLANGRYVNLLGNPVSLFPVWAEALGTAELLGDERFATPEARETHRDALLEIMATLVAGFSDFESLAAALASTPMLLAEVHSISDVASSDWAEQRRIIANVDGGLRIPRAPFHASRSDIGTDGSVRQRGADNAQVLDELLGIRGLEFERLVTEGVLLSPETD